jgi:regulator of PEP synthase PpsR (kinase-PPPase family)
VEASAVRNEVNEAKRLFETRKWPVIDVSRRSIEETAAEVLALHRERAGLD